MEDEKNKILELSERLFQRQGFQKTTMDEIARELRISKKTIYKHYSNKKALVRAVFERVRDEIAGQVVEVVTGEGNAIIKLYNISKIFSNRVARIGDIWLQDLQYHGGIIWEEVEEFRKKMMLKNLNLLVEQGKAEGLIVNQPNAIILAIIIASIQEVVNPDFVMHNNISISDAGTITLNIVFSGILTKKGRKLFKQYKSGN